MGDTNNIEKEIDIIKKSNKFSETWFKLMYDLPEKINSIKYYIDNCMELGLNPSPYFDTNFYLENNPDVKRNGINPFIHYLKYGIQEGRLPCDLKFDSKYKKAFYIILNSNFFNLEYYMINVSQKISNPILHYLIHGVKLGLNPSPYFDTNFYLENNPDVKRNGINPLVHYLKYGIKEGRLPKMYLIKELRDNNLKKCIMGKNNYLFLINDANYEIMQHYDKEYKSKFNSKKYNEIIKTKKEYFSKRNIKYQLFIVPDKSIICKDALPFKIKSIKRNEELLKDVPDFSKKLIPSHYFKFDTHINYEGAKILAFNYLNYIDDTFSFKEYEKLIQEGNHITISHTNDLLTNLNWSYSDFERNQLITSQEELSDQPKKIENLINQIPKEFLFCGKRESHYLRNDDSFSDLRVLIFHDSCSIFIKEYLLFYFREAFLYWDHGIFNENLVNWFKPDVVLEIRAERFLERAPTHRWR